MAVKLFDLKRNQASGAALTFDPLLRDIDPTTGLDALVAPDIVIAVPKQTATPPAITTALAVGNVTLTPFGAGSFDILSLRMHTEQRVIASSLAQVSARNVYFVIGDGVNLGKGAVYADNADATRTYVIQNAKVAGDTQLVACGLRSTTGTAEPAATGTAVAGTLNLVSGTGDAAVAFTGRTMEHYAETLLATAIANAGGTAVNPELCVGALGVLSPLPITGFVNPYRIPDMVYAIPKAVPAAATGSPYIAAALALGGNTIQHGEVAPVNMDVWSITGMSLQRLLLQLTGVSCFNPNDTRRYFTILNTANASQGAIYVDNADATRFYRVIRAKVSGDASLQLATVRVNGGNADVTAPVAGQLNLVSGTGDATIATTQSPKFEKYMDIRQNVALGGPGITFNPGLIVNGTPVMPDIVIPMPKAAGAVPYVPTDLSGAVGDVNVRSNVPVNCDILSLRLFSAFRVGDVVPNLGPAPIVLGNAGNFSVLAETGFTNDTAFPGTLINGNLGNTPGTGAQITGVSSNNVTGNIFTVNGAWVPAIGPDTNQLTNPAALLLAKNDMVTAYNNTIAAAPTLIDPWGSDLGAAPGGVILPGVYKFTGALGMTQNVILSGPPGSSWIFISAGAFTVAAGKVITMAGGASANNVFFGVISASMLAGAHIEGNILSSTTVTLTAGCSVNGRLLAQTAVTTTGGLIVTVPV
jgi:hypothetical protein